MDNPKNMNVMLLDMTGNVSALANLLRKEASINLYVQQMPPTSRSIPLPLRKADVFMLYADLESSALIMLLNQIIKVYASTPVVVVSPTARQGQRQEAISVGATDYVFFFMQQRRGRACERKIPYCFFNEKRGWRSCTAA